MWEASSQNPHTKNFDSVSTSENFFLEGLKFFTVEKNNNKNGQNSVWSQKESGRPAQLQAPHSTNYAKVLGQYSNIPFVTEKVLL